MDNKAEEVEKERARQLISNRTSALIYGVKPTPKTTSKLITVFFSLKATLLVLQSPEINFLGHKNKKQQMQFCRRRVLQSPEINFLGHKNKKEQMQFCRRSVCCKSIATK